MSNVCVIGTGYVGLVSGACFAEMGNRVRCVDIDADKVARLNDGILPIYEPGLDKVVLDNLANGNLSATTSFAEGMTDVDYVFVTVGTPSKESGEVDLRFIHSAYEMIADSLNGRQPVIINKSTVPPGTADMMQGILNKATDNDRPVAVVSNPEFLREGYAVYDFMNPSRIVIGSNDPDASQRVADLHRQLDAQVVFTEPSTAEMIKYASNSFLAMKISFINEIASMCDGAGIDVNGVAHGIGLDPRIGKDFLRAGIGYGGSCLPKDTAMLTHFAESNGVEPSIMKSVRHTNDQQPVRLLERLRSELGTLDGKKIAVFGLTFKPNTDDLRYSSALELVELLMAEDVQIAACDPIACKNVSVLPCGPEYVLDPYQAVADSDAVVLATEWSEYVDIDLGRVKAAMKGSLFVDGRNAMQPAEVTQAGFTYMGIGRAGVHAAQSSETTSTSPMLLD